MLRKKIFKILSVLVAVIIAFSSFSISAARAPVTGDNHLESLNFDYLIVSLKVDSGSQSNVPVELDVSVVGFSGDGSLRLHCVVNDPDVFVIRSSDYCRIKLSWTGDTPGFYVLFPDFFYDLNTATSKAYAYVEGEHLVRVSKSSGSSFFNCTGSADVTFSQFDIYISLTDPTVVPPMEAFLNDLGDFFSFSLGNFSDVFNFSNSNAPLLVLIFGFVSVGFVFGILYRLLKR